MGKRGSFIQKLSYLRQERIIQVVRRTHFKGDTKYKMGDFPVEVWDKGAKEFQKGKVGNVRLRICHENF